MERIELVCDLGAPPMKVFDAWLSTEGHSAMTGSPAVFEDAGRGRFTAWEGYIEGEILDVEPGLRILQTWRTTDFKEGEEDSLLELLFAPQGPGTKLTLRHSNLPELSSAEYEEGWREYYIKPMKAYFDVRKGEGEGGTVPNGSPLARST